MFRQPLFALVMIVIFLTGFVACYIHSSPQEANLVNSKPDKFAGVTKQWVNRLENEIASLKESYNAKIDSLFISLYSSNMSEKGQDSISKRIANSMEEIGYLEKVQWEIEYLRKSDQIYNVVENPNLRGRGLAFTSFNKKTGHININIAPGEKIALFAHELLHAYQFDRGLNSFGESGRGGFFLSDSTDEIAAYERQAKFGDTEFPSEGEGTALPKGPNSIYNYKRDTGSYRVNLPDLIAKRNIKELKQVAIDMSQAYRIQLDGKWMTIPIE